MHWQLASFAALGSLALAVPTEHVDKCAVTGQDKGTIAKSTSSPFNVTKSASDEKGLLDCNYDFSSSVTWVTKSDYTSSFLEHATNTGKSYSDGSYTGTVYTVNASWWRPLGTNGENSNQTYIDPTQAAFDVVVTDAQLPYYAYCLIGLLPSKQDAPAKSFMSSLKSQGLVDKEQVLFFGGQFTQWGSNQPSDYAWKSLQLAADKADFQYNATIPATISDSSLLVNASLIKPETKEKKQPYKAFFNMSDPVTYVPIELADEVWPSYVNVTRVPSHDGNTITYFWNCSIASYAQTQDFEFLFELATTDKPYSIKESSWTIQNGQCEGLLKGRKSSEIAFGSAVLDNMGVAVDYEASNIAFGSIPGFSSIKPDSRQTC